ncbi:uncharacterized protein LOC130983277 isoform X4 [Arachis stenosperma]|uniref:uncharacterized protein LOC130983277 isoform X4 n=1 Tax=Arachis stenosperma TaxID=217475 RepID=UPI0025ACAFFD|nr:uncharacterized protein LOC130983277 isoform X4 [Arachis stenosperma]
MEKLDQLEVISGRRHVGIMYAEPVVNYGIRLRGRVVTCKEKRELPNNSDFHSNQSNGVVVLNRHSSFCKSGLCSRQRPLVRRENNCRGARATDGGDNTCDYFVINGIKHLLLTLFSFFLFTIEFLSTLKLAYDAGFNLGEENEKKKEFFRRRNE